MCCTQWPFSGSVVQFGCLISWKGYRTKIGTVRHLSVQIQTSVANKGKTWEKEKRKEKKRKEKEKREEKIKDLKIQYLYFRQKWGLGLSVTWEWETLWENQENSDWSNRQSEMQSTSQLDGIICWGAFWDVINMWHRRFLYYQEQAKIFPRTYFEVEHVRPSKEERASPDGIFVSTPGGISIPGELNQNVLQFLTGKDLMKFALVSKSTGITVKNCKGLPIDAIQEWLDDFINHNVDDFINYNGRQVNYHKFKKKDWVHIAGINGYVVRVTKKMCITFVRWTYSGCNLTSRGCRTRMWNTCVHTLGSPLNLCGIGMYGRVWRESFRLRIESHFVILN